MGRFGLPPASAVTARDQLLRSFPRAGNQPLPDPRTPARITPAQLGFTVPDGPVTFYVIGDSGGVKDPNPQSNVAQAMIRAAQQEHPAFVWHVGDIVYFNGDGSEYAPQFFEPYAHLNVPVLGIPGNHDGDTTDDSSRSPLDTFMANFCAKTAGVPAADPQLEYGRDTVTQPYCYWSLELPQAVLIGLYSNVASGGHLDQQQLDWLTLELKNSSATKPVILSLHHPPLSVDAHHGGSQHMFDAIDQAATAAGRWPELVLSGHVHDYQRFTRTGAFGKSIPYIVIGNGGYHNLHRLAADAVPRLDLGNGITFEYGDDSHWGYLALTISGSRVSGVYRQTQSLSPADTF